MEGKDSFILYTKYGAVIDKLSNEQAGMLLKHIYNYVRDKYDESQEDAIDDMVVSVAWLSIKPDLKNDLVKWKNTCSERSKAGKLGAEAKKQKQANQANANFAKNEDKQTQANQAEYEYDNEYEYDSDNDNKDKLDKLDKLDKQYTRTQEEFETVLGKAISAQKKWIRDNGLDWSTFMMLDYDIRPYYYTMKLDEFKSIEVDKFYKSLNRDDLTKKVFAYTLDRVLKSEFKPDNFIAYFKMVYEKNFKSYSRYCEVNDV